MSEFKVGIIDYPREMAASFPKVKPSLILKGFGLQALKTKIYKPGEVNPNTRGIDYKPGEEETDERAGVSYLGTPVFMNMEFEPGTYTDRNGEPINYGEILKNNSAGDGFKVDTVLADVTIVKQIITTNIQGLNGSVKEYISQGDYQITIKGALVDESGQRYPEEQVKQLVEYCEVPESVRIYSRFLNDNFDIQFLTIQEATFPQVEGVENVQLFEIKAISDDPIELTINGITD